jgi:hypothetical protein
MFLEGEKLLLINIAGWFFLGDFNEVDDSMTKIILIDNNDGGFAVAKNILDSWGFIVMEPR